MNKTEYFYLGQACNDEGLKQSILVDMNKKMVFPTTLMLND